MTVRVWNEAAEIDAIKRGGPIETEEMNRCDDVDHIVETRFRMERKHYAWNIVD